MNKRTIIGVLAVIVHGYGYAMDTSTEVFLDTSLVSIIDGRSFGIDGERVAVMVKVRKAVREMLYGWQDAAGQMIGMFEFDDALYTTKQLAELETEYRQKGNVQKLNALKPLLKKVKADFMAKIKPFMGPARGAKQQMLLIIKESCLKRNRKDSILLRWGAAKEEDEARQFDHDVIDFKTFDTFCNDLVNFIEDVIRSCPKGLAQYKQIYGAKKR